MDEAIALMDADGADALTMRALGRRLGAGTTSMYRHIANRQELLELAVDRVYGEVHVPGCDGPAQWRDAMSACAWSMRAMVLAHSWIATALPGVGLHCPGPNVRRLVDELIAVCDAAGFPADEIDSAISTVLGYVVGMAVAETGRLAQVARSGCSEQQLVDRARSRLDCSAGSNHPTGESISARGQAEIRAATFGYGLERVLDGLSPRFPQGSPRAR
ncbi:TetR/AcrR family transcriptional regulator [Nocardia sp. NPDC058176]|uniref:TetR/AcrR family transcriptional regulator n=1 Tax=Nocardia sp. NPDC058176 TaxID=3346368 RepID=UPI0036DBA3F7